MQTQTDYVRARMSPKMKKQAEKILAKLGMGHTEAIRLFYRQVILQNGIPFSLNVPNAATARALRDVEARRGLKRYKNFAEFRKSLGLDG